MGRLRFAFRSLVKAPLLSFVVVASLALGIGVNTAIFSLLNQVVLSTLPVSHPEQLVLITSPGDQKREGRSSDNDSGGQDYIFNWRTFRELEKNSQAATVIGFRTLNSNIAFARQTVSGPLMLVSGRYFSTLGVKPAIGRTIDVADDIPGGGNAVAVLGYRYWRDKLAADPDVLNKTIRVNGQPFTVVGIAAAGFTGTTIGNEPDLFLPMSFKPVLTEGWNGTDKLDDYWVYLMARLKPGVSVAQAQVALNAPYHAVLEEMVTGIPVKADQVQRFRAQQLTLKNGRQGNSEFRNDNATALRILMLATGLVLLIAMANAANLLLTRAAERRKELAIRAAMGAGRGELMGQFLAEALLLAGAGGVAGLAIAAATLKLLMVSFASPDDSFASTGLNWPVLWFSLALSLVTGVLFGLYPAWSASRTPAGATLNDESGRTSTSRGAARLRRALVCAQLGLSVILLIPTGLFLKSLVNLLHVNLGIRTEHIVGFGITPQWNGYKPEQSKAIFDRAERELAGIPGVRSAVGSEVPLLGNSRWGTSFRMEGKTSGKNQPSSKFNEVGPGFFSQTGIPLIAGREFTDADTAGAPKVVIVNESFVKKFFDGHNPIGRRIGRGKGEDLNTEIVGVVKDSHYSSVREDAPPLFYAPWRQDDRIGSIYLYVRSDLPAKTIVPQIRAVMRSIDNDLPLDDLRTLDEQVHYNLRSDELILRLALAFAALATTLAMLGLYGVMAHGVARRTREIGIRMALGAAPVRIQSMVMRELLWIIGFGLGIGIPAALAISKLVESRLFGVHAKDVTVVAGAAILLALTAALAAYWPARRASRVNPLDALRYE